MPISAQLITSGGHTPKDIDADTSSTTTSTRSLNPFTIWGRPQRTALSSPPPHDQLAPPTTSPQEEEEQGNVQVSVLVAMPSPNPKPSSLNRGNGGETEVVPEIVVGVAQLPYRTSLNVEVSISELDERVD